MEPENKKNKEWIALLATGLGTVGAFIAMGGALMVMGSQQGGPGVSIWPLPGLVMMDWAILGVLGFLAAYLGTKSLTNNWVKAAWFVAGALIPLMVLGALSIGPYVLISLVFLSASAILVTIYKQQKILEVLGILALGLIFNLGLLFVMIVLGGGF